MSNRDDIASIKTLRASATLRVLLRNARFQSGLRLACVIFARVDIDERVSGRMSSRQLQFFLQPALIGMRAYQYVTRKRGNSLYTFSE
jgi:hypothetical protein